MPQDFSAGQVLTAAQMDTLSGAVDGYATTATAADTTTLTTASLYQQFFTGSTTQSVVMPVTSTLYVGQKWRIVNNSSGIVTVKTSDSTTIYAVPAGGDVIFTCILASGTTAASWDYKDYKVAASSGSMTSIASGTLPASTTLSLTSISGSYKDLRLVVNALNGSGNNALTIRINNDSGGNYMSTYMGADTTNTYRGNTNSAGNTSLWTLNGNTSLLSGNNKTTLIVDFPAYTDATSSKLVNTFIGTYDGSSTRSMSYSMGYYYGANAAITQIDLIYGSNYSGGTYILYGVN
jgi:hypothetical protein